MKSATVAVAAMAILAFAGDAVARDQIRIVGSSTVFPFTTAVAENFGKKTGMKTPVVESTGTGGGMKLFCAGVGEANPDFTSASRQIKKGEIEECAKNGVTSVTEIKVGFDGIVLAVSKQGGDHDISIGNLWLALAKEVPDANGKLVPNGNRRWSDIDPRLPKEKIEVLGPPPTSGTRDAFVELVMEVGCNSFVAVKDLAKSDAKRHNAVCRTLREDGSWIDAGENDNLIVQKVKANPTAVGVFGYSFLEANLDSLKSAKVGGIDATFENIASGKYPVSRSMFIYAKNQHATVIPGMKEFIAEYTSDQAMGQDGYLADKGLIPLPADERANVRNAATALTPLSM